MALPLVLSQGGKDALEGRRGGSREFPWDHSVLSLHVVPVKQLQIREFSLKLKGLIVPQTLKISALSPR